MIKVGGIQNTQVLWQAVFLAASPLAFSGSAAKTFFRARLQYRQLRRLIKLSLLECVVRLNIYVVHYGWKIKIDSLAIKLKNVGQSQKILEPAYRWFALPPCWCTKQNLFIYFA